LLKSGVDVLTFPDSPSGRTRADSILMAEKVARETGICVMPHICCRDKNAIAMRSQLLGAHINHIHNFLVITGDPIPTMARDSVKSVFNFDSVGLMRIMNDMNEDQFAVAPVYYGGAINQGRRNLEIELQRVKKKMEAGATFFLTQPVSTKEGAERIRYIKEETGARILCGIMPFVSLKNAVFMKNEMTGIDVTEEVLGRYREDMTREEGEMAGIQLAKEVIAMTEDFVDGYYFSFPFNRVHMLEKILQK
jgi:homocysteine S-methyltransferase